MMEFKPLKVVLRRPKPKKEDKDSLYITNYSIGSLEKIVPEAEDGYHKLDADTRLKLELEPPFVDLARIACQCYEHFKGDDNKGFQNQATDYKLICCAEKGSYHGCLYFRRVTRSHHAQLVIAHKGTTPNFSGRGDIYTDIDGVALSHYTLHQNAACTFAIWILDKLNYNPSGKASAFSSSSIRLPAQIIFTGHSLGGWLAQVSSFSAKYHKISKDGNSFIKRFNNEHGECEVWFHPRCIVFDSPGAYQMIEKLWHRPEFRHFMPGNENPRLDIKNLAKCPNHVNCINWHFGDLLLLPGKTLIEAKDSGNGGFWAKIFRTKETHDIYSFVKKLGKASFVKEKLTLVKNWPQAVFRGYSTSKEADKRQLLKRGIIKVIEIVGKSWKDDILHEFNDWWNKADKFVAIEPLIDGISINTLAFSRRENQVVGNINKIVACHFYGNGERKRHIEGCKELKSILDFFQNAKWEDKTAILPNQTALLFLQNLSYFKYPVEEWAKKIDTQILDYLANSKAFVDYLKQTYIIPKFANYEPLPLSDRYCERSFASKQEAKLYMIKLLSSLENSEGLGKSIYSPTSTLFIKSKHFMDFNNKYDPAKDCISLVIVNCFDKRPANRDIIKAYDNSVVIFLTPQSPGDKRGTPSVQDKTWLIDSEMFKICDQEVQLPNAERVPLIHFIGPEDNAAFAQELSYFPKILLQLLEIMPEELVQIGKAPPTVFESEGNYFHVGKVFNEVEIIEYYKKSGRNNSKKQMHNRLVVLVTEDNLMQGSLPNFVENMDHRGTKIYPLVYSNNVLSEYFKLCSENPNSFVDLVYFYRTPQNYQLKYQYNPGFYTSRDIYEPKLDFGGLVNEMQARDKIVQLNGQVLKQGFRPREISFNNRTVSSEGRSVNIGDTKVDLHAVSQIRFETEKDRLVHVDFLDKRSNTSFNNEFVKIPEKDLFSKDIVILSDEPGMGKSTNLICLAAKLNSVQLGNDKVTWVIFVELKSLNFRSSQAENANQQLENFIHFISVNQDLNSFEKFLLKTCLSQSNKKIRILFILDGFDEMADRAQKEFLPALNYLSVHTSASIYISTRRHLEHKLELNLGVFAHRFVPIQETQMVKFLSDLWFGIIKKDREKIVGFARALIEKSQFYLKASFGQVLGVPLLLKMLSEVYLDEVWDCVRNNKVINPAENHTLTSLYTEFTERKYKIYFQNKNSLSPHKSFPIFKESFEKLFVKLVVSTLDRRPGTVLTTFMYGADFVAGDDNDSDEYLQEFLSLGIAHKHSSDTKPLLPHQTFYEYFLAKFIFRCVELLYFSRERELEDFERPLYHASSIALENIFSDRVITKDGFVIRTFLNDLVGKNVDMLEKLKAITGNDAEFAVSPPTIIFSRLLDTTTLLSNHGQIPMLGFSLACLFNFEEAELIRILQNFHFTATQLFLLDSTLLRPTFVILNILQYKYNRGLCDIPFIKMVRKYGKCPGEYDSALSELIRDLGHLHKLDTTSKDAVELALNCFKNFNYVEMLNNNGPYHEDRFYSVADIRCLYSQEENIATLDLWIEFLNPTDGFYFESFFQDLVDNFGYETRGTHFPFDRIGAVIIKEKAGSDCLFYLPPARFTYPEVIRELIHFRMIWRPSLRC